VVSHCWSPDGQFVAVSIKSSSNVEVYKIGNIEKVGTWKKVHTFKDAS
jgi:actin related protein 2/3 complex subunit 1A/1B